MRDFPNLVETAFLVLMAAAIVGGADRFTCRQRIALAAVMFVIMWVAWPYLFVMR